MEADDSEVLFEMFENIQRQGIENTLQLYYGIYRAEVTSNEDPEERGRVLVRVVDLGQTNDLKIWIPPLFEMAGNDKGFFFPPEKGDFVRVYFHQGDPSQPHGYLGGWFSQKDKPKEFAYTNKRPEKRGILTRMGSGVLFSDEKDNQYVRLIWHKPEDSDPAFSDAKKTASREGGKFSFIELTKDGSIQALTSDGHGIIFDNAQESVLLLHKSGHSISMTTDGVTIADKKGNLITIDNGKVNVIAEGSVTIAAQSVNLSSGGVSLGSPAVASAVLGEQLLAWLATHTHSHPLGPTGPALVPPTPLLLSKSVKLKA